MTATLPEPGDDTGPASGDNPAVAAGAVPSGRWRLLLLGSLAINLLLAGAAAGSLWTWKRHHTMGGSAHGTSELTITSFVKTLPKERAKEVRRLVKQQDRPDVLPLLARVRQARRDAADVLAAPAFDQEKLTSAFAGIDTAEAAVKAAARGSLIAVAEHLSPAERQALAEHWKARRPRHFQDLTPEGDGSKPGSEKK